MWQDILIPIVVVIFSIALIPQIIHNFKTKKRNISVTTAIVTMIGTYVLVFVYFSLGLYISTILQFIIGILWTILLIQSVIYKK